jgi:hypothetical protein
VLKRGDNEVQQDPTQHEGPEVTARRSSAEIEVLNKARTYRVHEQSEVPHRSLPLGIRTIQLSGGDWAISNGVQHDAGGALGFSYKQRGSATSEHVTERSMPLTRIPAARR